MKRKRDMHFNRILEACEFYGITQLLSFRYNWNQKVITEFYATLFFHKRERIFMWMTNGRRFSIKLSQFTEILVVRSPSLSQEAAHWESYGTEGDDSNVHPEQWLSWSKG
jgi:hypothetical protein